jgi:hypothetical protein
MYSRVCEGVLTGVNDSDTFMLTAQVFVQDNVCGRPFAEKRLRNKI